MLGGQSSPAALVCHRRQEMDGFVAAPDGDRSRFGHASGGGADVAEYQHVVGRELELGAESVNLIEAPSHGSY